jgi:hypothetical protein
LRGVIWWKKYNFSGPKRQAKVDHNCFVSTCLISEERVIRRKIPFTLDGNVHWRFLEERERTIPRCFVGSIENGRVFGRGTVIDSNNRVVSDVSVEFRGGHDHPLSQAGRIPDPERRDESVAVLSSNGENGYFHWLFDVLPRVDLIESCPYFSPDSYYVSGEKSFQKEYLQIAGVDESEIIQSGSTRHINARRLIVPSLPSLPGNVSSRTCEFLKSLVDSVSGESEIGERIYISRR